MKSLFLTFILSSGAVSGGVRQIVLDDRSRDQPIDIRVMPNVITSIHSDVPIAEGDVVCGNPGEFNFKSTRGNAQLNFAPKPGTKIGLRTNCNIALDNGASLPVWLTVVDKAPDTLLELHVAVKGVSTPKKAESEQNDDRIFAAVEEYKAKARTALAGEAADAVVTKGLYDRTVSDGIVLALHNHVRLGPLGLIRFSVENRSRSEWPTGEVRIQWYVAGHDPKPLDAAFSFKNPVIEKGEEIFGAVVFDMYDMPADARFVVQVFEKNGARHPKLDGVHL